MTIEERIQQVMEKEPYLGEYGFPHRARGPEHLVEDRKTLLATDPRRIGVIGWVMSVEIRKTKTTAVNSYWLKHVMEEYPEAGQVYISNGQLILAAMCFDFDYIKKPESPNAYFRMNMKDVRRLELIGDEDHGRLPRLNVGVSELISMLP